jgi:hypothetical protein
MLTEGATGATGGIGASGAGGATGATIISACATPTQALTTHRTAANVCFATMMNTSLIMLYKK